MKRKLENKRINIGKLKQMKLPFYNEKSHWTVFICLLSNINDIMTFDYIYLVDSLARPAEKASLNSQ